MADSNDQNKPTTNELEHPISETDASKFVGQGDYALPVSPLDGLLSQAAPTQTVETNTTDSKPPETQTGPIIEYESLTAQPQPTPGPQPVPAADTGIPVSIKPVLPQPTLPDTANFPSQPPSTNLESQAKDMLKELDKAAPPKRKRRGGSSVTKMALAAVVVVLMGIGGYAGMKLFYTPGGTYNQSKANCTGQCCCSPSDESVCSGKAFPGPCAGMTCYGVKSCNSDENNQQGNKCPALPNCQCGREVDPSSGSAGCLMCTDCAKAAARDAAVAAQLAKISCPTGYYGCTMGCCQSGSGTAMPQYYSGGKLTDAGKTLLQDAGLAQNSSNTWVVYPNKESRAALDYSKAHGGPDCGTYDVNAGKFSGGKDSSYCKVLTGGYVYIGAIRGGTACFPDMSGGLNMCIDGGGKSVTCSSLHLIRCTCSNKVTVIGAVPGYTAPDGQWYGEKGSCDSLCGSTDNVCNNCCTTCASPPPQSYACTSLSKDVTAPKLGSTVTFTCNKSGDMSVNHYEFQYKIGASVYQKLDASAVGKNTSKPLTIGTAGVYTVQCRVCHSTDTTDCTQWGLAAK